jgi:TPR repeat protein
LGALGLCAVVTSGTALGESPNRISEKLREAAERGDTIAITRAALIAMSRKEFAEAALWYRRGAEIGHPDSQWSYAWMLRRGLGVVRDEREAFRWVLAAAMSGHPFASLNAGEVYAAGQVTDRDAIEALVHINMALAHLQFSETDALERARNLKTRLEAELSPSEIEEARRRTQHKLRDNRRSQEKLRDK